MKNYIIQKENDSSINQILKSLPSESRKLSNDKIVELLLNNLDIKSKIKDFYSRKGGRYKTSEELYIDIIRFISTMNSDFNKNVLKEKIKQTSSKIVFENQHTLVVDVHNLEDSLKLGSVEWCFSKTKSYVGDDWNPGSYWMVYGVGEFTNQYFVYDFTKNVQNPKSIVGITVGGNNTIVQCFDSTDKEIRKPEFDKLVSEFKHVLKGVDITGKILISGDDYYVQSKEGTKKYSRKEFVDKCCRFNHSDELKSVLNGLNKKDGDYLLTDVRHGERRLYSLLTSIQFYCNDVFDILKNKNYLMTPELLSSCIVMAINQKNIRALEWLEGVEDFSKYLNKYITLPREYELLRRK